MKSNVYRLSLLNRRVRVIDRLALASLVAVSTILSSHATLDAQEPEGAPSTLSPSIEPLTVGPSGEQAPTISLELTPEFSAALDDWKETIRQVVRLKMRYVESAEDESQLIRDDLAEQLDVGEEKINVLKEIAKRDFRSSPYGNPEIVEFLFKTLGRDVNRDRFDSANEICELLIDNYPASGSKDENYYGVLKTAAYSAYRSNHFENAIKYFEQVADFSELTEEDLDVLRRVKQSVANWRRELAQRAEESDADDLPRIKFETTKGDIVMELFENNAPNSVANIISLVEAGFYDGVPFHHVKNLYGAQTGCPVGDGSGDPGYLIKNENTRPDARHHFRGSVSLIPHGQSTTTCGSQIFFSFVPRPDIDGEVTVCGRVVSGMDTLSKLQRIEILPDQEVAALTPDELIKAEVLRKRGHEYIPEKY